MTDALGRPRSVLILGGGSEIGLATAARLVARGAREIVLLGRHPDAMLIAAAPLRAAGAAVHAAPFDAADPHGSVAPIDEAFRAHGDFDIVLLAFGVLGDQQHYEDDPVEAGHDAALNFAGAVASGLAVGRALRVQGHGVLVVFSSVAGQRPRRANFVYGAAKSGIDAFARGLDEALRGSGPRVMIVRPGFVHTRMTAHLPSGPLSQTADQVATAVVRGLDGDASAVWAPTLLQWVFLVLRHVPQPIFRLLKG
jgi:decaprenylphospho-beta-D-erythro-pentofuranosid-2-ulose 2-reductase